MTVDIDAASHTARVGVGVQGGALSERLAKAGFAFPVGHCVDVALSGYLIGGGFGWNAGVWGAACGNVAAIEMVTANGEIVVASADQLPDLFWAARGAGPGFFAAVTAFHLKLRPLPPTAYAWRCAFAASSAPARLWYSGPLVILLRSAMLSPAMAFCHCSSSCPACSGPNAGRGDVVDDTGAWPGSGEDFGRERLQPSELIASSRARDAATMARRGRRSGGLVRIVAVPS